MRRRWWLPITIVALLGMAIVAFIANGGRGPSGTPSQRLDSWVKGSDLGQAIGVLVDDGRNVSRAVAARQSTTSIHTVCAVLSNAAQTANQDLPSPDVHLNVILARAYTLEYDAGQACYRAGATGTALLAESARDRAKAEALLRKVLAEARAITGHVVPTTTTTVPGGTTTTFL